MKVCFGVCESLGGHVNFDPQGREFSFCQGGLSALLFLAPSAFGLTPNGSQGFGAPCEPSPGLSSNVGRSAHTGLEWFFSSRVLLRFRAEVFSTESLDRQRKREGSVNSRTVAAVPPVPFARSDGKQESNASSSRGPHSYATVVGSGFGSWSSPRCRNIAATASGLSTLATMRSFPLHCMPGHHIEPSTQR